MFKKELRLVVTEDCNYSCTFCHKEGMKCYEKPILTPEDYKFLYNTCKEKWGWDEITITGGEPFVRTDIDEVIKELKKANAKITVVTNGELINRHIDVLKDINRINISIHTLDPEKYDEIVQRKNKLKEVLENISDVRNLYPNINFRLNTVISEELVENMKEYISFAKRINASIKCLELYGDEEKCIKLEQLSSQLLKMGYRYKDISNISKQELTDGETTIILSRIFCSNAILQIDPEKYCNKYNDFFISPAGKVNICRNGKEDIDILEEIKSRNVERLIKKLELAYKNMGKNCFLCKEHKKLAMNGGMPVFLKGEENRFIHPKITKEIEQAVIEQLHKNISIYDNSDIFGIFEKEFAKYVGMKKGLLFNSGTTALWAAYEGIGLKKEDEIICPSYTFFATNTPILFTGAKPVLVDCDEYGSINVEEVKKSITSKTKAIVVTHVWGYSNKLDELRKIADDNNLYLIEDCSHAHGGEYKNKKLGSYGDVSIFSLQGKKIVTGGEGGILLTNNIDIYERALLLGHYNKRCKKEIRTTSKLYKYADTGFGMKLRAHPIAIRIAYEQLKQLDTINTIKNEYAKQIIDSLKELKGLEVLEPSKNSKNSWYALIIKYDQNQMKGISRQRFVEALHKEGAIEVDIPDSTKPVNDYALFGKNQDIYDINLDYQKGQFKNAEEFYNSIIKIPVWDTKEEKNIVNKYIKAFKKVYYNIEELM